MKKIKMLAGLLSCALLIALCLSLMTLPAAAEAEFSMEIPYGKPTVDGVIEEGEYQTTYVMDRNSAASWVGEVGRSKVTWHLAWDEGGLYYAGTINDRTPAWRGEDSHWVGIDCLELAINPGLLLEGDVAEGVFFSFGSTADGKIVAWRHNFADGLVSDQITGKNTGHVEGTTSYTMEVYIPWSLVQIDESCTVGGKTDIHLDATTWEPTVGAQLGLLPCAIDSLDDHGGNIIAYKFNGTDFVVCDFVVATLADASGHISPETEAPTEAPTEAITEAPTEAPTDTAAATIPEPQPTTEPAPETDVPTGGCSSTVAIGALMLMPLAWVCLRKKET